MVHNKNKRETPRVVIGLPISDSVAMKARTAHSIGCVILRSGGVISDFIMKISCDVVANRTQLVKEAILAGGTHILFVDSDMQFPSDAVTKMLAADKDIVGVEYNKRIMPPTPIFNYENKQDTLYQTNVVGTGLMLIKLSIFEKMKDEVWFTFGRNKNGDTVIGEDVWFCGTAKDNGFEVWIDPTIKCYHLGEYGF